MMKLRYQVPLLILMILASVSTSGCTSNSANQPSAPILQTSVTTPVTGEPAPLSLGNAQPVTIELTAKNMAFDQAAITVPAGAAVVVNFHNREAAGSSQVTGIAHNFAVYDSPAAKTTIFRGEIITGGEDATYRFTAPKIPGTYFFRCDVHPGIMNGTFIVR
jgi:plastocyanin